MINKGDVLDILLVIAIAGIAIGVSVGIERLFYLYLMP